MLTFVIHYFMILYSMCNGYQGWVSDSQKGISDVKLSESNTCYIHLLFSPLGVMNQHSVTFGG